MSQGYNNQNYLYIAPNFYMCYAAGSDAITYTQSLTANSYYVHFLGNAVKDATGINILSKVTTAPTGNVAWHEVGIFIGPSDFPIGAAADPFTLTAIGAANMGTGGQTGVTKKLVSCSITKGNPLWVGFGCSANVGAIYRATTADVIQSGLYQIFNKGAGASRLSTLISVTGPTAAPITRRPIWCAGALV